MTVVNSMQCGIISFLLKKDVADEEVPKHVTIVYIIRDTGWT